MEKTTLVRDHRLNLDPPVGMYVGPQVSAEDEIASAMFHVDRINLTPEPKEFKEKVLQQAETMYAHARWEQVEDWRSDKRVKEIISKLNMKSGPGYPYCHEASTNESYLKKMGVDSVVRLVQDRLDRLAAGEKAADPVRIFIKREPHDVGKAANKRWRMIWNVSLIDQIIDSLLWQAEIDVEILRHKKIPSKPGWTPLKGGMNYLFEDMYRVGAKYGTADKSSWDFTVPGWMLWWDMECRFRLCNNYKPDAEWVNVAKTRFHALYGGEIIFSNGWIYQQTHECILRSGSKVTISTNSRCQVLLKLLCFADIGKEFDEEDDRLNTMGDDSIERLSISSDLYANTIRKFGFIVKFIEESYDLTDPKLHFCSERFKRIDGGVHVSVPVNWEKNLFNLCWKEQLPSMEILIQTLDSYCQRYAWDEEHFPIIYQEMMRLVSDNPECAHIPHSVTWYQNLVTGFE